MGQREAGIRDWGWGLGMKIGPILKIMVGQTFFCPCAAHFALVPTGTTIKNVGTIQTPRVGVGSLDWLGIKPLGSV